MADASSIFGGAPAPATPVSSSAPSIFGGAPAPAAAAPAAASIFGAAPTPVQQQQAKVANITQEAQVAKANSDYSNSFTGLALNTIKGLWTASGIPQQFQSGQDQVDSAFTDAANQPGGKDTPVQAAEGALSVGSGLITKIFSPLAPVFNVISKAVTDTGNEVSNGSPTLENNPVIQKIAEALPDGLVNGFSPAAIQKFANSPAGDMTTRIAQDVANASNVSLAVFGGIEGLKATLRGEQPLPTPEEVAEATNGAVATENGAVASETTPAESVAPVKTLSQSHVDYAKSQGYEPYTPNEDLPVIDAGKPAKSELPTIQTEAPAVRPVKGDLTIEPIKQTPPQRFSAPFVAEKAPSAAVEGDKTPTEGSAPAVLKPAESLGETKTSKLASGVNENAVAKKLTDTLGDLPEYNKVSMKEQAQYAADLIANEPDKAMRIAMGEEAPPAHILPEAVFTALEDKATSEGDVDTLQKLATKSNLSSQATAMGQRIRALGERDDLSPVSKIQELKDTREDAIENKKPGTIAKTRKTIADSITTEIKKATSTRQSWEDFAKQISCNY